MTDFSERTQVLLGQEVVDRFRNTHIFIAGIGGVGSFAVEILTRAGIGKMTILDADLVTESNINRQLIALRSTIGRRKTDVMRERMLDINPDCQIRTIEKFITKGTVHEVFDDQYDLVIDAIDVLNPKLALLTYAFQNKYHLYSSLGAGNKLDPTKVASGDLFDSDGCRLAKTLRKYLRREGVGRGITAVWSSERARPTMLPEKDEVYPRSINGTISSLPSLFGITLAGLVLKDIVDTK